MRWRRAHPTAPAQPMPVREVPLGELCSAHPVMFFICPGCGNSLEVWFTRVRQARPTTLSADCCGCGGSMTPTAWMDETDL